MLALLSRKKSVRERAAGDIGCRVANSGAISINNALTTALTFDTERYDTDGMHSSVSATGRITINRAGKYQVGASIRFAANATGQRSFWIQVNGSGAQPAYLNLDATSAGVWIANLSTVYNFAAGDYIEVKVYQDSGGALNVDSSSHYSPEFWAQKIDKAG